MAGDGQLLVVWVDQAFAALVEPGDFELLGPDGAVPIRLETKDWDGLAVTRVIPSRALEPGTSYDWTFQFGRLDMEDQTVVSVWRSRDEALQARWIARSLQHDKRRFGASFDTQPERAAPPPESVALEVSGFRYWEQVDIPVGRQCRSSKCQPKGYRHWVFSSGGVPLDSVLVRSGDWITVCRTGEVCRSRARSGEVQLLPIGVDGRMYEAQRFDGPYVLGRPEAPSEAVGGSPSEPFAWSLLGVMLLLAAASFGYAFKLDTEQRQRLKGN